MPKRKSTAKQPSRSQRKPRAARTERTRTRKHVSKQAGKLPDELFDELQSDGVVDAEMEELDTDRYEIPQWWR